MNYTSPSHARDYLVNITIRNMSLLVNTSIVQFNLSVSNLTLNITNPTIFNKTTNITAGDSITINAYTAFAGVELTNSVSWSASISGSNCPVTSSSYSNNWTILCTAPLVSDGINHNLSLQVTYTADNSTFTDTETNATQYRDITPPVFNSFGKKQITPYNDEPLEVNVTDNINISTIIAQVNHSNSTITNYTLDYSNSNSNYTLTLNNLSNLGNYDILYYANDTAGNLVTESDWFGVFYLRNISGEILKGNLNPQVVTIEFSKPNSTLSRDILSNSTSNSSTGYYNLSLSNRTYDIKLSLGTNIDNLLFEDINATNLTQDFVDLDYLDGSDLEEIITLYKPLKGIAINTTLLNTTRYNVTFNYTSLDFSIENNIYIHKCSNWSYQNRNCSRSADWTRLSSNKNKDLNLITSSLTGFSSFFVTENVCGNGLCQAVYGETETTCATDCIVTTSSSAGGGSGGGGGGGLSTQTKAALQQFLASSLRVSGVNIGTTSIYKELFAGEETTAKIQLKNTQPSEVELKLSSEGIVSKFITFLEPTTSLKSLEEKENLIKISVPKFTEPGLYEGNIIIQGKTEKDKSKIPITIKVLPPEGKLIEFKIEALNQIVTQGGDIRLQVDIVNLGKAKDFKFNLTLQLINSITAQEVTNKTINLTLEDKISEIMKLKVPLATAKGKYIVKGIIVQSSKDLASSITFVEIKIPFLYNKIFGIPYWLILIIILVILSFISFLIYLRILNLRKRRYAVRLDTTKLPQPGKRSVFLGKVAETGIRTFMTLDKLQTHTLIAGATGGGKTVAAEVIIEEALLKGISVIVFDPTAQWTGFLRKNQDKTMFNRYRYFEMKKDEAKAFNGTIKTITDPLEFIDLKKYIKPGEIAIFNISKLTPKESDLVVASTIQQIFKMNLPESKDLNTLIVYDEVHRLLPKFGGSGTGFIQLERGVREFRKWGVGLILISQVLSDFVGEIKANISTEIQTNTRYEDDLERIKLKYGDEILKSVVKESVGTVMFVNAEYNNGRPYFVSFRPLLHNHARLTEKELETYEKYSTILLDLYNQVDKLKENKVDTIDIELELKLASSKIKQGQFNLADIYLDSLNTKISNEWKKLNKTPPKLEIRKLSKEEILEGVEKAKEERQKYVEKEEKLNEFKQLQSDFSNLKKKIEELKTKGINTSLIEIKFKELAKKSEKTEKTKKKSDLLESRKLLDSVTSDLDKLIKK